MDADETLSNIRALLAKVQDAANSMCQPSHTQFVDDASTLAECIDGLDQWLQKGGALPAAWLKNRT